jgi:hypothetical protein
MFVSIFKSMIVNNSLPKSKINQNQKPILSITLVVEHFLHLSCRTIWFFVIYPLYFFCTSQLEKYLWLDIRYYLHVVKPKYLKNLFKYHFNLQKVCPLFKKSQNVKKQMILYRISHYLNELGFDIFMKCHIYYMNCFEKFFFSKVIFIFVKYSTS